MAQGPRSGAGDGSTPEALPTLAELIYPAPWRVSSLSDQVTLGPGWWGFNPSVHRDPRDGSWRCAIRFANYNLLDGVVRMSPDACRGRARTRTVVTLLDEELRVREAAEVLELDRDILTIPDCSSSGLEDMRLFLAGDQIMGIAAALQHNLRHPGRPEMVLCYLDQKTWSCTRVSPLRDSSWDYRAQKNWVPFDGADRPIFLASIERGVVITEEGVAPWSPPMSKSPLPAPRRLPARIGSEVRIVSPPATPSVGPRILGRGSQGLGSSELRGGSQLVSVGKDLWVGVAHEMNLVGVERKKRYWHTLYAVNSFGQLTHRSVPFKLSQSGIEFAAGLSFDPTGRCVLSYGTDDHDAWVAQTHLDALLSLLLASPPPGDPADPAASAARAAPGGSGDLAHSRRVATG